MMRMNGNGPSTESMLCNIIGKGKWDGKAKKWTDNKKHDTNSKQYS